MKKYIAFPIFILLVLMNGHNMSAQTVDLVASVDATLPVNNNDTFIYTLEAVSTGNEYDAVQIKILYDPSKLQLNNFNPNAIFNFVVLNDTSVPGEISFTAGASPFLTSTQTIFTVEFEVLNNTLPIVITNDDTSAVARSGANITGTKNNIDFSTLSISNNIFKNNLSIYPNPVKDNLFIKLSKSSSTIKSVKINAIDGKLIQHIDTSSSYDEPLHIDVSNLTAALYFLTVTSKNDYRAVYKFVVKK